MAVSRTAKTQEKKVFISEFRHDDKQLGNNDGSFSTTLEEQRVIPKQENSFGGRNCFVPRFVPQVSSKKISNTEERFEAALVSEEPKAMNYGLQERSLSFVGSKLDENPEQETLEAFRSEVAALPDEADSLAYEQTPVEVFGLAMLRGMGWKEGQVVGKDKDKKPVDAVEFVPRASRLGLGAAPNAHTKKKRGPAMVLSTKADGKVRHVRGLDEELVPYSPPGLKAGQKMRLVAGKHNGFVCTVLQSPAEDVVEVKLPNEEVVQVSLGDLSAPDQLQSEEINPKTKRRKANNASSVEKQDAVKNGEDWMIPKIRVKIVDKELNHGFHYLKKGVIVDIVRPGVANILLEGSDKLLEEIKSSSVETIIPTKSDALVLVLAGEFKGQKGKILDLQDTSSLKTIQLISDLSLHKFTYDQISEYKES